MLKREFENFIYNDSNIMELIENMKLYLDKVNFEMIKAISAFYELIIKDHS